MRLSKIYSIGGLDGGFRERLNNDGSLPMATTSSKNPHGCGVTPELETSRPSRSFKSELEKGEIGQSMLEEDATWKAWKVGSFREL